MSLINCEINLILTWSASCVMIYTNVENQNPIFEISEKKLYVPVVALTTQDTAKLITKIKSDFKKNN